MRHLVQHPNTCIEAQLSTIAYNPLLFILVYMIRVIRHLGQSYNHPPKHIQNQSIDDVVCCQTCEPKEM